MVDSKPNTTTGAHKAEIVERGVTAPGEHYLNVVLDYLSFALLSTSSDFLEVSPCVLKEPFSLLRSRFSIRSSAFIVWKY